MVARFFRSDAMVERLGEAGDALVDEGSDSYQITYNMLRDMEGEVIGTFDDDRDTWLCHKNGVEYSDVVIYTADEGEGERPEWIYGPNDTHSVRV